MVITGAGGFIGTHCLKPLLARGFEVHAVDLKPPRDHFPGVQWHTIDLFDPGQVASLMAELKPSHLLHLAWYAEPGAYWSSPENLRWVHASLGLLQEFHRQSGKRVVMAGTCAEYDWKQGHCSERMTPLIPSSLYGSCKHALQIILGAYATQTGLSSAWGRVFFLYGPGENPKRLVPSVIRALLRGEKARCTNGSQIRDFLYVKDVADAFIALLDSEVTGSVNIASGQPLALKDLIYRIADHFERRDLVELGALKVKPDEPPILTADVTRLTQELGWQKKYKLDVGLKETIESWDLSFPLGQPVVIKECT